MQRSLLLLRLRALLLGIAVFALSGGAMAEPPSRAARLSNIGGSVSFSPAGQPDWVQAMVNRPLTTGDRLWTDANSRAELQIGGAAIRLGAVTSMTLLNLDDRIAQVELSQGTLKVRVRSMRPNQVIEVDTPNLAFTLRRPGEYRIDVGPNDDATAVVVQSGRAEVNGEGASYAVTPRQEFSKFFVLRQCHRIHCWLVSASATRGLSALLSGKPRLFRQHQSEQRGDRPNHHRHRSPLPSSSSKWPPSRARRSTKRSASN